MFWSKRKSELKKAEFREITREDIFRHTNAGELNDPVSVKEAYANPNTYSAIKALSEALGCLPAILYKRNGESRERAKDNNLYLKLKLKPNKSMTASVFWEVVMKHLLFNGNAYIYVVSNKVNEPIDFLLLDPNKVKVRYNNQERELEYFFTNSSGKIVPLTSKEILHVKVNSTDGFVGRTPFNDAPVAFNLAKKTDDYANKTYAGDATPSGVLTVENPISEEEAKALKSSWISNHGATAEEKTIAILQGGMKFEPISFSPHDAKMIESRNYNMRDIAKIFRVPPHLIGDLERATFSNIEHQDRQFIKYVLLPYIKKIEEVVNVFLLDLYGNEQYYMEFLYANFLRGDSKTQAEVDEIYLRNGVYNSNEVREMQNKNHREGGDQYALTLNPNQAGASQAPNGPDTKTDTVEESPDLRSALVVSENQELKEALKLAINEKFDRLVRASEKEVNPDKLRDFYRTLFESQANSYRDIGFKNATLRFQQFFDSVLVLLEKQPDKGSFLAKYRNGFADFLLFDSANGN